MHRLVLTSTIFGGGGLATACLSILPWPVALLAILCLAINAYAIVGMLTVDDASALTHPGESR